MIPCDKTAPVLALKLAISCLLVAASFWSSASAQTDYYVDFTDTVATGNEEARNVVISKGFFASNAAAGNLPPNKVGLSLDARRGLAIHMKKKSAFGWSPFTFSTARNHKDTAQLMSEGADILEISWGVDVYPDGWKPGQIRHAIQVIVEFSTEGGRRGSGILGQPGADDFLAFSLCESGANYRRTKDRADWFWIGKMYKQQGRYACAGSPRPGEILDTRIDLAEAYAAAFGEEWGQKRPAIASVGIAAYNYNVGPSAGHILSISLKQN